MDASILDSPASHHDYGPCFVFPAPYPATEVTVTVYINYRECHAGPVEIAFVADSPGTVA